MTCPNYDEAENMCKELGMKFYTGMQKPCLDLDDPSLCQILLMRGG